MLSICAPDVAPDTMTAIVSVESGGNPLALHDNSTQRAYWPHDRKEAIAIAQTLLAKHHSLDIGIAQINSYNFAAYHLTIMQMLHPCTNLQVASRILRSDYQHALAQTNSPNTALWEAISAYNTGSFFAGKAYVAEVVSRANTGHIVPTITLLTQNSQQENRSSAYASTSNVHNVHGGIDKQTINPFTAPLSVPLTLAGKTRTLSSLDHKQR